MRRWTRFTPALVVAGAATLWSIALIVTQVEKYASFGYTTNTTLFAQALQNTWRGEFMVTDQGPIGRPHTFFQEHFSPILIGLWALLSAREVRHGILTVAVAAIYGVVVLGWAIRPRTGPFLRGSEPLLSGPGALCVRDQEPSNRMLKKSFPFSPREKVRMRGIVKTNVYESKVALTPALSRRERGFFSNLLSGGSYGVLHLRDGWVVARRGAPSGLNAEAVRYVDSVVYRKSRFSGMGREVHRGAATVKRAVCSAKKDRGKEGMLLFGPYLERGPGGYVARVHLSREGTGPDAPGARIDVTTDAGRRTWAEREVRWSEIPEKRFGSVEVAFEIPESKDLEIRVRKLPGGDVCVDEVMELYAAGTTSGGERE